MAILRVVPELRSTEKLPDLQQARIHIGAFLPCVGISPGFGKVLRQARGRTVIQIPRPYGRI